MGIAVQCWMTQWIRDLEMGDVTQSQTTDHCLSPSMPPRPPGLPLDRLTVFQRHQCSCPPGCSSNPETFGPRARSLLYSIPCVSLNPAKSSVTAGPMPRLSVVHIGCTNHKRFRFPMQVIINHIELRWGHFHPPCCVISHWSLPVTEIPRFG